MERRRFLALLSAAAAGVVATACGVRSNETSGVTPPPATPAPTTPRTTRPTTTSSKAATATTTTTTSPPPTATIQVICKEAWGAQPVFGDFREHQIDQITVHHTAVLLEDNRQAPALARRHQAYHQDLGWPDIAYHFLVDAGGNVYEGRPVVAAGDTATDYDPTGHLLICCEGNFDQQQVPAAQYVALIEMLAWGAVEFDINPATIRGHRDLAGTSCPGDALHASIADGTLHTDVARVVNGGTVQLELICGGEADTRIAAIEAGIG